MMDATFDVLFVLEWTVMVLAAPDIWFLFTFEAVPILVILIIFSIYLLPFVVCLFLPLLVCFRHFPSRSELAVKPSVVFCVSPTKSYSKQFVS